MSRSAVSVVLPDPATGANPALTNGESPLSTTLTTRYTYDEVGNKLTQTDAEGRTTRWEYDAMGRETARILPLGQRETKEYNAAGELVAATDFNGRTTRYTYDAAGRAETIDYPRDADVSFGYSDAGERITVVDGRGTSTTSYDRRGRVTRAYDADGFAIEYEYDEAGNLLARISPSQSLVYTYDDRHRMTAVTRTVDGEAPMTTRYEYDQDGNRAAMLGGDGIRTEYTYDRGHRLTNLVKKTAAGVVMLAMAYTVDASGMRQSVVESDTQGVTRAVAWEYDAVKRLTKETIDHRDAANDRTQVWTYDRVGNRQTQVLTTAAGGETTAYGYDRNDRLLTETKSGVTSGTTTYTYDDNGNTLSKSGPEGSTSYGYDDANRLVDAVTPQGQSSYTYTADGLRVRQIHTPPSGTATTTWYVQDMAYPYAHVVEEYTSQGAGSKQLAATFTFADELVSQTRYAGGVSTTKFLQADGFGSTRWLTDAAGAVTDTIDYDAFGIAVSRTGETDIEHLYRAERLDANLAMYDLRARLYAPSNGRFLTQDTFSGFGTNPLSLHKYLYADTDPVNKVDPSGHFAMTQLFAGDILTMASVRASVAVATQVVGRRALVKLALYVAAAAAGAYTVIDNATKGYIEDCMRQSKQPNSNCRSQTPMFIIGDDNNEVRDHVAMAIASGKDASLSRKAPSHSRGWIEAHKGPGKACPGGAGTECDEYPWAASNEGGQFGNVSLRSLNQSQNSSTGSHLRWFHHFCKIPANNPSSTYTVVPMKGIGMTGYVCK